MRICFRAPQIRFGWIRLFALYLAAALPVAAAAAPVASRRPQEPMHRAFLLRDASGKVLAHGEEIATIQGNLVHSRLTFRFQDGSLDDEQTVFLQDKVFHLISDHHVQKGPSFPTPVDLTVDVPSGTVTWHDKHFGHDVTKSQHLSLPDDVANGIMPLLVENFPPGAQEMRVSWVAIAMKPLIVDISVKPHGTEEVDPPGGHEQANEYILHPELHGFVGFLAPLVNKTPGDIHIWVSDDKLPSFARLKGPFYQGAPDWTVEPAGPARD